MKPHNKRVRSRRALAIAGCLASLAAPTAAVAMPLPADPPASTQSAPAYAPDAFAGGIASAHSQKPADESGARLDHRGLRESTKPAPSVVVRETHVTGNSDRTFAIALAASALGIALCASGYAVIRVWRMQRIVA